MNTRTPTGPEPQFPPGLQLAGERQHIPPAEAARGELAAEIDDEDDGYEPV